MRASGPRLLPLPPLLLLLMVTALFPRRGLSLQKDSVKKDFYTWWDNGDPPTYDDPVFIKWMLEEHNRFRAMVDPPAADMLHMTWDLKLSEIAKAYVEKCVFGHNPDLGNPHKLHPVFKVVGENIWLGPPGTLIVASESWYNETRFYTYSTQACSEVCGHYTQLVWANSYKLGCAAHVCNRVPGFEEEFLMMVICNYGPAGNFPSHPYVSGIPCSSCIAEDTCENNLCNNPERDTIDLPVGTGRDSEGSEGREVIEDIKSGRTEEDVSKASLPLDHPLLHVLLFNCCYTLLYLVYQ
ncbi:GLIPR1-like protein 1 isoform X1 [Ambystoma mexicanum]|uniref:GLIPR1-like protein 1 isoform X1 n=1 Tax=Ambystoma mexicanum TaxID=8296 RepID=UPI0037E75180